MPAPKDPQKREEWLIKLSSSLKGRPSPNKGKHFSEETKRKISEVQKGRCRPQWVKDKISNSMKNIYKTRPGATSGKHISENHKEKIRMALTGKPHLNKEARERISESRKAEKNPMWNGGVSFKPYCHKFNTPFKERVRAFFSFQCVECGTPQKGKGLHVHHVTFNKESCCDSSIPLFVALCDSCHSKSNHNRKFWQKHFTEMINQYYGGKCYFTEEEMLNGGKILCCA